MTDTAALRRALEAVEQATGPDREIDRAVAVGLGYGHHFGGPAWMEKDGKRESIPEWTADIDAVVSLIEREMPGWCWGVARPESEIGPYRGIIGQEGAEERAIEAPGPQPALALLAVFLRAKLAKAEQAEVAA